MEVSPDINPASAAAAILQQFPLHLREGWIDRHPVISRAKALFLPSHDTAAIRLESNITPQELIEVADLKNRETALEKKLKTKNAETYLPAQYQRLRTEARKNGPTENLMRESLALSIVAAKRVYSTEGKPFDVWNTQRIALLRITKNLINEHSSGLVADLRTGMGKSDVLAMITLPVGFMVKDHWDMISRTPQSRMQNAKRFAPLGNLLGIRNAEVTEHTTCYWENGARATYIFNSGEDLRTIAMRDGQVTFATRKDIAPYILQKYADGQYETLRDVVQPDNRGCIMDEIDAEEIDEGSNLFIISGVGIETPNMLRHYWEPLLYPKDRTDSLIPSERISNTSYETHMKELHSAMKQDILDAQKSLGSITDEHSMARDENTVISFALLRKLSSFQGDVEQQNRFQKTKPFFTPDGQLTTDGEYDLFRRLYHSIVNTPYDGQALIPADWENFFDTMFPAHITETIVTVFRLKKETDYFIQDGVITVKSPLTGWPRANQEFDPLTTFTLYAKESLNADQKLIVPKTLHETIDAFSSPELDAILYSKIIGLTGTGLPVAQWFRGVRGLDITAIPPEYAEKIDASDPYILVRRGETKKQALEKYLTGNPHDPLIPMLFDVSSAGEDVDTTEVLSRLYAQDIMDGKIQHLSASNAQRAREIFDDAGQPGQKTIAFLMAGREVDIPVDDRKIEELGGLEVISLSPRRLERNEQQLKGRTGRAGKSGVYRCFVSADDDVFKLLLDEDRVRVTTAIEAGDRTAVDNFIHKGQQKYEKRLQEQNEIFARIYKPLVAIRRRMLQITPEEFTATNIFWQDFLTMNQTWGTSMMLLAPPQRFDRDQLDILWQNHVLELFQATLSRTSALLKRAKTDPKPTKNRIHDVVTKGMNASMRDFGLTLPS